MASAFIYFIAVLGANLTATLFIPFPIFGQVAVGTFIFGITFSQRDRMHNSGGRAFVYKAILFTAVMNTAILLGYKYYLAPGVLAYCQKAGWPWIYEGLAILQASSLRLLLASFVAIILSESADTEIYHRLRERSWLVRVARSNAVSIPLDTLVFNLMAFAGIFPAKVLLAIMFGEIVVKYLIGLLYGMLIRPKNRAIS
ncbi:MAG: queuosine precursor transporter [Verrucomicrobiota bacterium]|nr:queuosine precursor transporter [Verrucomicrobiota bacterium]